MRTYTAYWISGNRGFYESISAHDIHEAVFKAHEYEKTVAFANREVRLVIETREEVRLYQVLEERKRTNRQKRRHSLPERAPGWDYFNGYMG